MTQKELMYLEDAIGHENTIIAVLKDSIVSLEDNNLVSFMKKEEKEHQKMKSSLIKYMEDKANE